MNLKRAEMLATDLMAYHLPSRRYHSAWAWKFKFDNSVTRLGYCDYKTHIISLGKHATLVNSEEIVLNTICHEIGHALARSYPTSLDCSCNNHRHGHCSLWRKLSKEIGCDGERLGYIAVKAPYKYQQHCTDCGYVWKYYRKPKLGPCYIHKCKKLLERIGYIQGQPWHPVASNLKVEELV